MEDARTSCEKVWQEAVVRCREILGEEDFEIVAEFGSPDQLISEIQLMETQYRKGGIPRMLDRLQPHLSQLSAFVNVLLLGLGPCNISTAVMWGTVSLLIHLASESEKALNEITNTLSELGQRLILFQMYSEGMELEPYLLKALFDILVDLVLCSVSAIKHFRKNDIESATVIMSWSTIRGDFTEILQELSKKITHLKELVEVRNMKQLTQSHSALLQQLRSNGLDEYQQQEQAIVPCQTLPFMRNPSFHGRTEILDKISQTLGNHERQSIQSAAIWGLGGVGKSQIALEFAHQQFALGCPIVLWIPSEKDSEIASAFNKAANQLRVPGFLPTNTPEQNRYLVLQFLQITRVKWLLIFDNVEDLSILDDSRPITGDGTIVFTCRSEFVAAAVSAVTIEIPTFTAEDGSALLFKVIGQPISLSTREMECSFQLSERLGGLALAVDIMGKQIRARKKTVEQFLAFYDEHRQLLKKQPKRGIGNHYYSKNLETVWETSFNTLSPGAAGLLRLLCFVAPDSIPDMLFTRGEDLPPRYAFLTDPVEWEDAKIELLDLSLISVNSGTLLMSIHRLTQEAYFDRMEAKDKLEAYAVVLSLLHEPFSRKAGSHLYSRWDTCSKFIQHVQALGDRYKILGETKFYPPQELMTIVFNDAAWYLVETGFFRGSKGLTDIASVNCVNKKSLEYADLLDTISTICGRQSQVLKAKEYWGEMLAITLTLWSPNDERVPRAYNATVNGLVGMWQAADAIEYGNKAVDYGPREISERLKSNPDRWLRCRGCAFLYNNDIENAKKDLAEADYWQDLKHGKDSHYHGEAAYLNTKIAIKSGSLDEAYTFSERAFKLLSLGKPTHAFVAATKYQQGCIRLRQAQYDEALARFREALIISEFNELNNGVQSYAGTSARCKWRMSQVLKLQGLTSEARLLLDQAKSTKKELYDTGLFVPREDEDESWDTLVPLLFR